MNNKKRLLVGIAILSLGVFSSTVFFAFFYFPSGEVHPPSQDLTVSDSVVASTSLPARLIIPALDIDTKVQHLGITRLGNMAAPKNYTDVGWYKYGTVPGIRGSAVMAGHLDNGFSLPAVFDKLSTLKSGDDVYVKTVDGKELHFVVESSEVYKLEEGPLEKIFKQDDTVRLNLITCEGWWTRDHKTFDHRRVVYTVLKK